METGDSHPQPRGEAVTDAGIVPVTVIIPVYQREKMIGEAVRSVLEQTRPVAEILVVDDGSTDRTADVAERLGARVLRQDNQGVSAARNAGIRAASQDWIALLDSDDLWKPEKIASQWEALALRPDVGLSFTDFDRFDESGLIQSNVLHERDTYSNVRRERIAPDIMLCDRRDLAKGLFAGNLIKPSTLLARRRLLLEVGLFDPTFGHAEDRDLSLRLVKLTDALVVERALALYRHHEGGASQDRIRMALGAVEVADRVFASPDRYPDGAVEFFRDDQPRRLREAGILLMEQGRQSEARTILWRSLCQRPQPRTLLAWGVSLLGSRIHGSLTRLKRRVGMPGLRSGSE